MFDMKVIINDTSLDFLSSTETLKEAVLHFGIKDFKGLAVAVNNSIIPINSWEEFNLNENDSITIIRATQGG
jgi:sulfur carrier protein